VDAQAGLRWLDGLGLALVAVCLVLGARRGLWWQAVRLLGVVSSLALGRLLAPRLALVLCDAIDGLDERLALGWAWLCVVAAGLALVALVGRLGQASIELAQLRPLDRLAGAAAGALTGALVHAALVLGLAWIGPEEWSERTLRGTRSAALATPIAPEAWAEETRAAAPASAATAPAPAPRPGLAPASVPESAPESAPLQRAPERPRVR
jgi:membrane protein required for colicin V production